MPPVAKVESVVERDVPISVEYVGTLVGSINAKIRSRVGGHLISQDDKEGFVHVTIRYRTAWPATTRCSRPSGSSIR